jgi:putative transcriptional regulator
VRNLVNAGALALLFMFFPAREAAALPESLILVATPELSDPLYGKTVLVVKAFGAQQHVGFIVNRPTRMTLGKMFPDHAPSQKITDPVFLGGPADVQALFALVRAERCPGTTCLQMMPGLFAVIDAGAVDKVIEANGDDARFVMGLVVWRPGELQQEVDRGAWYVLDSDSALALRDPKGLWEELVLRSRQLQRGMRVRHSGF